MRRDAGRVAAVCIALLYGALALSAARDKGFAYDELGHITAGASYWLFDDYRLQPENGNLPQRLAGLPVALGAADYPAREQPAWYGSDVWELGRQLCFELGNDDRALLLAARACCVPLGIALALLVYCWSRALFGTAGGLLSMLAFALSPAVLAHGALATSDMAASAALLFALACVARVLQRVTPLRVLLTGLATGALLLCKVSALLLAPVVLVLLVLRVARRDALPASAFGVEWSCSGRLARAALLVGSLLAALLLALAVVWAAFGFRYAAMSPADAPLSGTPGAAAESFYSGGWPHIEAAAAGGPGGQAAGPALTAALWLRAHRLLPEAWLYGFSFVLVHSTARASFLDGEVRSGGRLSFFPRAFACKTPLGESALLLLALLAALRWRARRGVPAATSRAPEAPLSTVGDSASALTALPLLLLSATVWVAALTTPLNIGHRHLLPAEAPLCVLLGAGALWLAPGLRPLRLRAAAVLLALLLLAAESFAVRPHYLGFFNALAGGPSQGWRHLVDSSLDWGQDLPGLAQFVQHEVQSRTPAPRVYLSYFGKDSPASLGIEATLLPGVPESHVDQELFALTGGVYCISATMLWGVYTPVPAPWSADDEQSWSAACADLAALDAASR